MSSLNFTIQLDDKKISGKSGDNLLDTLLTNNVDVNYGCRAGVCGACRLYDKNKQEEILCCQVNVSSPMSISSHVPSPSIGFMVEQVQVINEFTIELTLLGPSDDSFGDRVSLLLPCDDESVSYDSMAINSAGEPLKLLLQKASIKHVKAEGIWRKLVTLTVNDTLQISSKVGVRKGRLLYEMGLDHGSVLVVSTFENSVFEPYWESALKSLSSNLIGFYSLPSSISHYAADRGLTEFIRAKLTETSQPDLQIIYHGQRFPQDTWQTILRPLRLRMSQLHFVR
ncbi:2Fe-2S iron-sulfur cluster binding domain-containing protein [Marinomonas sp. C2222]|uniref:2Fe-2S iron-sulfur cluster binding domain-containing protein n=1 Tax=Marinomonas sargassi TaxID=2984494 RepID=A0ABT2YSY8_9GAMM|nr:2Fe-2S iron-sulfur cluster binding domain-containing protein [Marinomonas sargassi]MCV2403007.1 2Fe-2S iron-sulfur cluster binding domain-containing protein [Marinomonas sargassi]